MKKVLDFEIKLANVSMPEAERQDTGSIYKRLSEHLSKRILENFQPANPILSFPLPQL